MARCCPASSHGPGERRGRVRACHPLPTMMTILDLFKSICCGYYCFCHVFACHLRICTSLTCSLEMVRFRPAPCGPRAGAAGCAHVTRMPPLPRHRWFKSVPNLFETPVSRGLYAERERITSHRWARALPPGCSGGRVGFWGNGC